MLVSPTVNAPFPYATLIAAFALLVALCTPCHPAAGNYDLQQVAEGVYAAVAIPGGKVASNALVLIDKDQVTLAGAHFIPEGIAELTGRIAKLTSAPIRSVILTHHHKGFSFVDFDFPPHVEMFMTRQTWEAIRGETRPFTHNVVLFDQTLTLVRGNRTIILSNTGHGHTVGDAILHLPAPGLLFASDMVFNGAVGFMGDGNMREWVINLEAMEEIGATTIVPGIGHPGPSRVLRDFKEFFRDFLTEIIRLKSAGRTLVQAKKEFIQPEKYRKLPGYGRYMPANIERAYGDGNIR